MIDVEWYMETVPILWKHVAAVVQMLMPRFMYAVRLVSLTDEHMYSRRPGDWFSVQGVIFHDKLAIYSSCNARWLTENGIY